jgi:hypothetical protein
MKISSCSQRFWFFKAPKIRGIRTGRTDRKKKRFVFHMLRVSFLSVPPFQNSKSNLEQNGMEKGQTQTSQKSSHKKIG